jgi:hypothetical protein
VALLVAESSEEWIVIVADQLRSTSRGICPKADVYGCKQKTNGPCVTSKQSDRAQPRSVEIR